MVVVLKLLVTAEIGLLAAVAYLGVMIGSVESARGHATAGIIATIGAAFIHCLFLFYLNGCARAIKDAAGPHPDLLAEFVPFTRRLRKRAYPPATAAILLILASLWSGGWVHSELLGAHKPRVDAAVAFVGADGDELPPELAFLPAEAAARLRALREDGRRGDHALLGRAVEPLVPFPVRSVPFWWVHLAVLAAALPVNLAVFVRELDLVAENAAGVRRLDAVLAGRSRGGHGAHAGAAAGGV
jgi:hypothetical protein